MNNPTEFPPKDDTENKDTLQTLEEVETYTTPEIVDSHLAALRVRQLEEKDTDSLIKEKRSEINELIDKALEQKPKGDEAFQDHRLAEEKQQKRSWLG
jgi:DNA-directed RNA polymerase subunit K/omega